MELLILCLYISYCAPLYLLCNFAIWNLAAGIFLEFHHTLIPVKDKNEPTLVMIKIMFVFMLSVGFVQKW